MKFLITIWIFTQVTSFVSLAKADTCKLSIPISDIPRALNPPVVGPYLKCEDFPDEECICIEKANTWYAELKEEIVNGDPIYSPKENVVECAEDQCKELGLTHCSALTDYQFFYAATSIGLGYEAYCAKLTGYEQVKTGKHLLVESEAKKAAYEKALKDKEKAEEDLKVSKKADIAALKALTTSDLTSNAKVVPVLLRVIKYLKEE